MPKRKRSDNDQDFIDDEDQEEENENEEENETDNQTIYPSAPPIPSFPQKTELEKFENDLEPVFQLVASVHTLQKLDPNFSKIPNLSKNTSNSIFLNSFSQTKDSTTSKTTTIKIPSIVFIGDQSDGKTSLLQRLIGLKLFPTGE